MGKFTERKAYIYALEIIAQVLAIVSTGHLWKTAIWCWMDNEPGRTALTKRCGRDRKVNRLLAALWNYITMETVDPHWRRVCSAANISDSQHGWTEIQADGPRSTTSWPSAQPPSTMLPIHMRCFAEPQGRGARIWPVRVAPLWTEWIPDQHAQTLHPSATDRRHRIQKE